MESIITFFLLLFGLNGGTVQEDGLKFTNNKNFGHPTHVQHETYVRRRPDPSKGNGPIIVVDDTPFKPPKQN